MKDKIMALLAVGTPATQVATAVGVTDGYISQLLSDPEFSRELAIKKVEKAGEGLEIDDRYTELEKLALTQAEKVIPFETRLPAILRTLQVANSAKRRTGLQGPGNTGEAAVYVNIQLPESARVSFVKAADGQVIEVAGRSLATLPTSKLSELRQSSADAAEAADVADKKRASERLSKLAILQSLQVPAIPQLSKLAQAL